MTINEKRHQPNDLMRCAARPPERYGDVELSAQASRFHTSDPRNGCGHTPLELYDRVEVALRWANTRARDRWIRQPSRQLGMDGFDDLWSDEVPIAEYVPQDRVQALRAALIERTQAQRGQAAVREVEATADRRPSEVELEVDTIDIAVPVTGAEREAGLT